MNLRPKYLLLLCLLLNIALSACSDTESPSPTPVALSTTATTFISQGTVTPEIDPVSTYQAEQQTLALDTPGVINNIHTPTATPVFAPSQTPLRGLTPAPITPVEQSQPLPKGGFVVATNVGLFWLSADGKDERNILSGYSFSEPKVAPDGSKVALFRTDPISLRKQFILVSAGGVLKPVTEAGGTILSATWSPDSKTLALTRVTDDNGDGIANEYDTPSIWLYDVATDKQRKLTDGHNPAWSQDGQRLLFVMPGQYNDDIDPSTHKPRRSPNSLVLYTIQNNTRRVLLDTVKKPEITLPSDMEDGLKGQIVTLRYFKEVAWHPDGKRLTVSADALTKSGGSVGLVLTVTTEDLNPKLVTAGGDAAVGVAWSDDGKRLAYEIELQFPVKPSSAFRLALVDTVSPPQRPRLYIGMASNRTETRQPRWINHGQQLAFQEIESGALVVLDESGNISRLVGGCNGFDWLN
ncbi:MAG: PD40 domain-containing protein [Chloroflexi bacterium]|uniref:PD40 domain-containing protein n=1 Tax=Candidatus Chlorohelix allophototropha TaxID=3003348 RepID=A0A8T7M0A6_9CHLR|nr:PD40 domain-containing protein [Chloroflexota bacterium]WJW66635.1 hypothetical protein OZ401_002446 [Chloroflexota bacterium L227-S17]